MVMRHGAAASVKELTAANSSKNATRVIAPFHCCNLTSPTSLVWLFIGARLRPIFPRKTFAGWIGEPSARTQVWHGRLSFETISAEIWSHHERSHIRPVTGFCCSAKVRRCRLAIILAEGVRAPDISTHDPRRQAGMRIGPASRRLVSRQMRSPITPLSLPQPLGRIIDGRKRPKLGSFAPLGPDNLH